MPRARPWTTQPPPGTPIDWGNPLSRGIGNLWTSNRDAVHGTQSNIPLSVLGGVGVSGAFNGTQTVTLTDTIGPTGPFSYLFVANWNGTGVGSYYDVMARGGSDATVQFRTTTEIFFQIYTGSGYPHTAITFPVSYVNLPVVFVGVYSGPSISAWATLLGRTYYSSAAAAARQGGSAALTIGLDALGRSFEGMFALGGVWPFALSTNYVNALLRNPWQLFLPETRRFYSIPSGGAGSLTGSAAATEGADTAAGTGNIGDAATAAITEAADSVAATGAIAISATAAITEGADAASATGATGDAGTAAITNGADTVSATGALSVTGSGYIVGSYDAVSATGSAGAGATAAISEQPDTSSGTGALSVTGSAAAAEQPDTASGTGSLGAAGRAAIAEASDALAASGTVSVSGLASIMESGDIVVATGAAGSGATAAITSGADTAAGTGSLSTTGRAAVTEGADTIAATGAAGITGVAAILEAPDYAYGSSQAPPQAACTLGAIVQNRVTLGITQNLSTLKVLQ